jgi:hypothetical protein
MKKLAAACERIAATTKKLEKTAIVAEHLRASAPEEAAASALGAHHRLAVRVCHYSRGDVVQR